MSDDGNPGETRVVFGSRLVSAAWLAETADGLDRALTASLGRAAGAGGPGADERPGREFDVEFAGLTDLVRDAFGSTSRALRDRATGATASERNYVRAEQANVQASERLRASVEEW
ncbi:hypothetical protein [Nonomuraea candida]|uniref:hypothetical protein n=1 Tax=Nonomuraea candida TaxID=359159 RepID=UPI0012F78B4C|nr:hypothetical protein [Nonomuraea candida]